MPTSGGDPFKKVQPGDALQIPAAAYNAFIDAAKAFAESGIDSTGGTLPDDRFLRHMGLIHLQNPEDSEHTWERFQIAGLEEPLIYPTENLDEFKNKVAFIPRIPDGGLDCGKFAVLLEPMPPGGSARALMSGVVPVRLLNDDGFSEYVDVLTGKKGGLQTTPVGSGQILWRQAQQPTSTTTEEPGDDAPWAIVRISNPSGDIAVCTSTSTSETSSSSSSSSSSSTSTTPEETTSTSQESSTSTSQESTSTEEPSTTTQDGNWLDVVTNVYCTEDGELVVCTTPVKVEDYGAEHCGSGEPAGGV